MIIEIETEKYSSRNIFFVECYPRKRKPVVVNVMNVTTCWEYIRGVLSTDSHGLPNELVGLSNALHSLQAFCISSYSL